MKKLMLFLILGMFLVSFVSSANWDNKKSFDKDVGKYGKVEFRNSFLGLSWLQLDKVSTLELKTNTEVCNGNNCEAIKEIVMYEKGKLIDDVRYIDLESGKEVPIKDYQIQYKKNNKWIDYNYEEVNGNSEGIVYEVRLIGELLHFQTVDWQVKAQGFWLEEWAVWTAGLNNGLVAYFNFDEGTGALAVDRVNGIHNGTVQGGEDWITAGKVGGSLNLSENLDYVTIADHDDLDLTQFTINFWTYRSITQPDGNGAYLTKKGGASAFDDNWFILVQDGVLKFLTGNGAGDYSSTIISSTDLPVSAWSMVTAKINSTDSELFLNGASIGIDNSISTPYTNTDLVSITEAIGGTRDYYGEMDEFGIWNRSLTEAEITQLWNGGTGLNQTSGLIVIITQPTAIAYNVSITNLNYTITGIALDRCWNSLDNGLTNSSTVIAGTNFTGLTSTEGSNTWNVYCNNSFGETNVFVTFAVDTLFPTLTINEPTNTIDYGYINKTQTLNWSVVDSSLDSIQYNYNGTNVSVTGASNTTTFSIESFVNRNLTLFVNDSVENENSTSISWNYKFWEDNQKYSTSTLETTQEYFYINGSYNSSLYIGITANLIYNNTLSSAGSNLGSGDNLIFNTSVVAQQVSNSTNIPFYWNILLNDGSTTISINTTIYNQTVNPLVAINITTSACSAGFFESVNFTFKDAENLTALNTNVKYNFEYGTGNTSSKEIFGNFISAGVVRVCINESVDNYLIGYGEIDYEATNHVERRFYLYENQKLSNETTNEYAIYDLLSADATSFVFEIQDAFLSPYQEKLVSLLRWYPDLDEYKTTEMAKTDEDGKTVMKVKTEDVDYRVAIHYLNGTLISLQDPVRMACLINPCTHTIKVVTDETDFFEVYGVENSLTYDTTNDRFIFTWNDPSGNTDEMNLQVYKEAGFQSILICNETSAGATGAMICSSGNYTGILFAKAYRTASPIKVFATLFHTSREVVNSSFGLFAGFIFSLAAGLIGIFSPVGAIAMLIIGLVPALIFGTINMTIFMGIVTLGGIIIHYLRKV